MSELKNQVIELLKSYPQKKRQIEQLKFELQHLTLIGGDELIGSLSLGSQSYGGGNSKGGYISNKTMMIALQYPEIAQKLNNEPIVQITNELQSIEVEVDRIDRYLSLLEQRQADVIRLYYFECRTWAELENELFLSKKTLQNIRDEGVNELARMYQFIDDVKDGKKENPK